MVCRSPSETKKAMAFRIIVPPEMASTFTLQELKGDTKLGAWAGKVEQYVLGLEVGVRNSTQQ